MRARLTAVLLLALAGPASAGDAGTLVIAGGAVRYDNAALFTAFFEAMPDRNNGRIAVITAASSSPAATAARFREGVARYGIDGDRIAHVRLAVRDDASTPHIDESRWSGNAADPVEVQKVLAADAIWLAGGDQSRYVAALGRGQAATPMLEALRQRLEDGAVIGGTSAGAAVMSDPMITGGGSFGALLEIRSARSDEDPGEFASGEALSVGNGLGFFPLGIVDQHFGERARLGRLAASLEILPAPRRLGFGVDEDTALIVDLATDTLGVAGRGNVTLLDGRQARWIRDNSRLAIRDLSVSVFSPGDRLVFDGGRYTPAAYLEPTTSNEYNDYPPGRGGGMALPQRSLARTLGAELLDNAATKRLQRYSFEVGSDGTGPGFLYHFRQTKNSRGYWGYDDDGRSRYTVIAVGFDILPVNVRIETEIPES